MARKPRRETERAWLLAGLVLVVGAGLVYAMHDRPPRLQPGARLLLIGDSHAGGLSPQLQALAHDGGIELRTLHRNGTRIDQWDDLAELEQVLAEYEPDLVLVSLGTNDDLMGADAATRQAPHLDALLAKLRQCCTRPGPYRGDFGLGAEVIWIGSPTAVPGAPVTDLVRERVASCCDEHARFFASEALALPLGPDGIHPTASGYAGWAAALWEWLS